VPTALVTGSAKGIGKALVLALAEDGFDVGVHYRSSRDAAESVVREALARGSRAIALQADVTRRDQAEQLVESTCEAFGSLDVLINNVGDYHRGPLADLPSDTWHAMFDSNLHATFYTCQKATAIMRAHGGGRIINIGYAGAENLVARPGIAAYAIAKTGVILYSKALAKSEAANGITVNVISPGVMENSDTKPLREIPMQRSGRLEELIAAARFLLAPEASYVTGVTIEVAGGWNL
jgi:NAD(P)-dependent dehydrogenase (short-subunit alcohol dehydrogenase family)